MVSHSGARVHGPLVARRGAAPLFADNGSLSKLGDAALARARDKLKDLEHDTRFKRRNGIS
jgi:hypothetical protein